MSDMQKWMEEVLESIKTLFLCFSFCIYICIYFMTAQEISPYNYRI